MLFREKEEEKSDFGLWDGVANIRSSANVSSDRFE